MGLTILRSKIFQNRNASFKYGSLGTMQAKKVETRMVHGLISEVFWRFNLSNFKSGLCCIYSNFYFLLSKIIGGNYILLHLLDAHNILLMLKWTVQANKPLKLPILFFNCQVFIREENIFWQLLTSCSESHKSRFEIFFIRWR